MAKTVKLTGRDTGPDAWGDKVKHFPGQLAGNAHAPDFLGGLQMYCHASNKKSAKDKSSTPSGQTALSWRAGTQRCGRWSNTLFAQQKLASISTRVLVF